MAFASGNKAYGISDRSGFRYRLKDMKKEKEASADRGEAYGMAGGEGKFVKEKTKGKVRFIFVRKERSMCGCV